MSDRTEGPPGPSDPWRGPIHFVPADVAVKVWQNELDTRPKTELHVWIDCDPDRFEDVVVYYGAAIRQ